MLGNLGTNPAGFTNSAAYAINEAGVAVGYALGYDEPVAGLLSAVYWGLDGVAVDLSALIDPASGWTLNYATAISNTGWIAGNGLFDPDGDGGQAAYDRLFLMHVSAAAIPEPANVALFGVALLGVARRDAPSGSTNCGDRGELSETKRSVSTNGSTRRSSTRLSFRLQYLTAEFRWTPCHGVLHFRHLETKRELLNRASGRAIKSTFALHGILASH